MPRPLCRYCGKPIAKYTLPIWFKKDDHSGMAKDAIVASPRSKAEAQKHTNGIVTAVRYSRDGTIWAANVWDGQSYVDPFFCSGEHAKLFAHLMAYQGHCTTDYTAARALQREKEENENVQNC